MATVACDSDLQILNELQHGLRVGGLEEVRLIKDKRTGMLIGREDCPLLTLAVEGQSRQFAFAQFVGIPEARRFLEKYYPYVSLHGAYRPSWPKDTDASKVRVAFSRDRDDRDKPGQSEDDWKCEVVGPPVGLRYLPTDEQNSVTSQTILIGCYVSDAMPQERVGLHIFIKFCLTNRQRCYREWYCCRAVQYVGFLGPLYHWRQ